MSVFNCDILISGGTIITQNATREIIQNGSIVISGSEIIAVGKDKDINDKFVPQKRISASGQYIFPGLINTHTHLFQTFIKGIGEGLSLYDWIDGISAPSASSMSEEEALLSTLLGGIEAIHSGTTTVLDFMYSMPNSNLHRQVANGFLKLGIRGVLGLGLMENGEKHGLSPCQFRPVSEALSEWNEIRNQFANPQLSFALAPELPFGITRESFEEIRYYATTHKIPITLHINESEEDDKATLIDFGKRAVPFLDEIGFWKSDVIAVHCIKMQPEDIDIFIKNDVRISHNPISNMYIGLGYAPIIKFINAGLSVSLATDGAGSNNSQDMFEVMKCTGLLHKFVHTNPEIINSQMILDMATLGGAKAIGQEKKIGSLEVGKQADLFIFDPIFSKSVPVIDPIRTLVFSAGSENVVTTIVAGKIIMENKKIANLDESTILEECQRKAWKLGERVGYIPKYLH